MAFESTKSEPNWQTDKKTTAHQWEFFKNPQGQWNWRLVSPEGWDYKKSEWKQNAQWNEKTWGAAISNNSSWNSLKSNIEWVEVSRSNEGYPSKTDCQAGAKKQGWIS